MLLLNGIENLAQNETAVYNSPVTEDTVRAVIRLIRGSRHVPLVRAAAEDIIRDVPEKNWTAEIRALYDYVKNNMRYVRDYATIELIKTPDRHLRDISTRGKTFGDCDDHTVLLGALLVAAGYNVRIVIIQSLWNRTGSYNHIFLQAAVPGAAPAWLTLDATAKDQPFGYVPKYLKIKMYDV